MPLVRFKDFTRTFVAGVEIDVVAWDFELPEGVTLAGTPAVTVSCPAGTDETPQAIVVSQSVGTATTEYGTPSTPNCAILAKIGPVNAADYLMVVSCADSDGNTVAGYNHLFGETPA